MGSKRFAAPHDRQREVRPLRRVVTWWPAGNHATSGAWVEELECGHEWHGSPGRGSRPSAERRRCRACRDRPPGAADGLG